MEWQRAGPPSARRKASSRYPQAGPAPPRLPQHHPGRARRPARLRAPLRKTPQLGQEGLDPARHRTVAPLQAGPQEGRATPARSAPGQGIAYARPARWMPPWRSWATPPPPPATSATAVRIPPPLANASPQAPPLVPLSAPVTPPPRERAPPRPPTSRARTPAPGQEPGAPPGQAGPRLLGDHGHAHLPHQRPQGLQRPPRPAGPPPAAPSPASN